MPTYRRLLSWYFLIPVLFVLAGMVIPLAYLLVRAFQADTAVVLDLVFRWRNAQLLLNTVGLAAGVLAVASCIAFPMAWLTARTNLRGRGLITLAGVLPLAVPGYVLAYALLAATGARGTLSALMGVTLPRPNGFTGSLLALSIYTFPYLFLNVRSALLGIDPSLEESARTLGYRPVQVFVRLVLPQLRPGFYAGALMVGLHVLGDFGVVSLMRFETFSYALYLQYTASYDRIYAAWLALILLAMTGAALLVEARLLRGLVLHRAGIGTSRRSVPAELGLWSIPAYAFVAIVLVVSVAVPVMTVSHWMTAGGAAASWSDLGSALGASVSASAPAAILATLVATSIGYLSVRMQSPLSRALERVAYFGYATPPLAFALALVFFTLHVAPVLYQTLMLLILAYTLHFLAEAVGPVRTGLYHASPRLEEAARSLGLRPLRAFFFATFPLLRRGVMVSIAFVFLSAMKELPLTFLLSPTGFTTLAMGVWGNAHEALFSRAAPYALAIMAFSAVFVGILLLHEQRSR